MWLARAVRGCLVHLPVGSVLVGLTGKLPAVDWLQRHLVAASANISPTHRYPKRHAQGASHARIVDVDQSAILLAQSSSSSGSSVIVAVARGDSKPRANASKTAYFSPTKAVSFSTDFNGESAQKRPEPSSSYGHHISTENRINSGFKSSGNGSSRTTTRSAVKTIQQNGLSANCQLINRAFQFHESDSPPPLVAQNCPPFVAWPPVPSECPAISSIESDRVRHRSKSPFARPAPSLSPRRFFPVALRSARSILQRNEYSRVPEELDQQQSSAQAPQRSSVAVSTPQRRLPQRRQIHVRRLQNSTHRTHSTAYPKNYGSEEIIMRPYKFDVVLQFPELLNEELEKHAWNPEDRSMNIYLKEEDRLTLHRHPVAQSTDAIRGKIGYSRGFHVWRLVWPMNQRGTNAVIGVTTKNTPLHVPGYHSLIGLDSESYGWDIVNNKCFHDSKNTKGWTYPPEQLLKNTAGSFQVPETILCVLDMDEGQLSFATESIFLGVAFTGLKGKKLYPVVSAVWGHCEITLKYVGGMDPEPRQLMDICRRTIRLHMGKTRLEQIQELNLPPNLKRYLLYK